MSSEYTANLDLGRVAEHINVILTEIYGQYVAQGSPTKLGGLRFLDVESAKTFAFEKTRVTEKGNLLMLSAPVTGNQDEVEEKLRKGPHAKNLRETVVRASSDAGKKNKYFVEAAYFLDTPAWLKNEDVLQACKKYNCNGNEAINRLLKEHVLPIAADIMDHFIAIVRAESVAPSINAPGPL